MQPNIHLRAWILVWSILVSIIPATLRAQEKGAWRLEKQGDAIQVFSRSLTGQRLKEIRVHADMIGTPSQLVALFSDVDNYKNVIYKVKSAHVIRRVSDSELFYYSESEMPWPAQNRDLVIHLRFSYNQQMNVLQINANSAVDLVPLKPSIVRVPFWSAVWHVHPTGPNRMDVDYTFQVDPGGSLPAWLINMTAAIGPYQSFRKLQEALLLPRYQNQTFGFLAQDK